MKRILITLWMLLFGSPAFNAQTPSTNPPTETSLDPVDGGWPREVKTSAGTFTVYQPQIDAWDGHKTDFYAALSIIAGEAESAPVFGVAWLDARTDVDKDERLVTFSDIRVLRVSFPSIPENEGRWRDVVQNEVAPETKTLALDRFEAALEVLAVDEKVRGLPVKNDPPRIVVSTTPAILVIIDGPPVYRQVADTRLERVLNTRALVVRDGSRKHYLRVFDGWLESTPVIGPWTKAGQPPGELNKALEDAEASGTVDLLLGGNPEEPESLPSLESTLPAIVVATEPTELIVTTGEPNYVPIAGTGLLYVENTTGHLFKLIGDQKTYVLLSGRWFRSSSLEGPWEHVANDALPADFSAIPDDSPKENVKSSVAGTAQAKEALISNSVPQTAEVKIAAAKIDPPKFDGEPKLAPIEGTELSYVVNTATPIVVVGPGSYYAVQNGIWFVATSLNGPWRVATAVPAAIYTIPPSASLHYVTYVRIYGSTPEVVYVGYTGGYYGTCVSHHVVVYGTGYRYPPYVGSVWYGPPVTYGPAVSLRYTPWTGWTLGFGFGWSYGAVTVGWGWGTYPWWGPVGWGRYYPYPYYRPPYWGGAAVGPRGAAAWGPGGWAATTGNVYSRWGSTSAVTRRSGGYNAWTGDAWRSGAGMSYNSRTGTLAAGQRSAVGNVYTGNYAAGGRGTVTNTRTGQTVSGGRVTAGNARTGQGGSAGYIRGEQGGIARAGGDVYATKDGNVYRKTPGGSWDQHQSGGGWSSVESPSRRGTLEGQQRARSTGQVRTQNFGRARGGGGRRRR